MSAAWSYDVNYLKSISGILKISCLLCLCMGILCILCSATVDFRNVRGICFLVSGAVCFICTLGLLLARLYQLQQLTYCYNANVYRYEAYLLGLLACIIFIGSTIALTMDVLLYSLAVFLGFNASLFYAYDAYLGYRLSRLCDAATQTTFA